MDSYTSHRKYRGVNSDPSWTLWGLIHPPGSQCLHLAEPDGLNKDVWFLSALNNYLGVEYSQH